MLVSMALCLSFLIITNLLKKDCINTLKRSLNETTLPIILYNIPGRSVVNISVDTVVRLAQIPNIVAIKEASGNLDAMAEIIRKTPEDFSLYSGDDSLTLPVLSIGGTGVISVAAHIIGNEMQTMINQFKNGKIKRLRAIVSFYQL